MLLFCFVNSSNTSTPFPLCAVRFHGHKWRETATNLQIMQIQWQLCLLSANFCVDGENRNPSMFVLWFTWAKQKKPEFLIWQSFSVQLWGIPSPMENASRNLLSDNVAIGRWGEGLAERKWCCLLPKKAVLVSKSESSPLPEHQACNQEAKCLHEFLCRFIMF